MAKVLIHPTALVDPSARLEEGVEIGAYAVIGAGVSLGTGTRVMHHAVIEGQTTIGKKCTMFPFACIGMEPQDKKAKGVRAFIQIGDENSFREYVTVHLGSMEGSKTIIGHRNLIMANAHIAHDCVLGNDIVIANSTALAGHVTVEDQAVISGLCGIHQFVRIGKLSMTGGLSKAVQDVLPFSTYDGHPALFKGPNAVGLKRAGFSPQERLLIKKALKELVDPGLSMKERVENVRKFSETNPAVAHLLEFVQKTKRGIGLAALSVSEEEEA